MACRMGRSYLVEDGERQPTASVKDRRIEEDYEVEISHEGEAGLPIAWQKCTKNPGHPKFIPVKDFNIKHLPSDYQSESLVEMIQCFAPLTVRLRVSYVSEKRPSVYPQTIIPFPFFSLRGKRAIMTGTGMISQIYKTSSKAQTRSKKCPDCLKSSKPHKEWWACSVTTARHVIFDGNEAAESECKVFYDDRDEVGVKKLYGVEMGDSADISGDKCDVIFHSHDMKFGEELQDLWRKCLEAQLKVENEYNGWDVATVHRLTIIVSHPHGCEKKISIGEWKIRKEMTHDKCYCTYRYDTCTCRGSSGAPVWILNLCSSPWLGYPHSRSDGIGLNWSGVSRDNL